LKRKLHNAKASDSVSQQVTFTSKFVENSSDVTEAMNVSGGFSLGVLCDRGILLIPQKVTWRSSGMASESVALVVCTSCYPAVGNTADDNLAYVDSSVVKESDISYFVQVKVVNQQLVADELTRFNAISNVSAADRNRFTDIYGDSFVSGFLEGGEFNALLTVKVSDKSKVKEIKGSLSLKLEKAGFGIEGRAEGGYDAKELLKHAETSIT
jgi:hypothetical protein